MLFCEIKKYFPDEHRVFIRIGWGVSLLKTALAIFIFSPVLLFILIVLVSRLWYHEWYSPIRTAADLSTFFFVLAAHFILESVWEQDWLFPVFAVLFIFVAIFLFLHRVLLGTLKYRKVVMFLWRSCFLFFFFLYILLFTVGMITYVIGSVST